MIKDPIVKPNITYNNVIYGTATKLKYPKVCKYCNSKYHRQTVYKGFCSWNCKCAYVRKYGK